MARARKNNETVKVLSAYQFRSGDVGFALEYKGISLYRMTRKIGTDEEGEYFWFAFPTYKSKDDKYYKYFYVKFTPEEEEEINRQIEDLLN